MLNVFLFRWYVASTDADTAAKTMKSTAGEELDFVSNFTTAQQWKRRPATDESDPYTPEERLEETCIY